MSNSEWPPGWHVEWLESTTSTNAEAARLARSGCPNHQVVVADFQTAGRGRLDRRWEAPAGSNLLASIVFRDIPPYPHELTQRVALAAHAACQLTTGALAALKWPNDLLLGDRKLAGVLAEAGTSDQGPFVVVGIGVNIGWAPPEAIALGDGTTPRKFLYALLQAYDALPSAITAMYRSRLATVGQLVRVELPRDEFVVGRAIDVEADGRLVVLDDCAVSHRIDTGDVVHLRRLS